MMRRTPRAAVIAMAGLLALGPCAFGAAALAQQVEPPPTAADFADDPVADPAQPVEPPPTAAEFADDPAADEAAAARAEAAGLGYEEDIGAGAGMPQLDARTYASQILWLVITFALLFYLLKSRALPRVADILEARQERIGNDLDKAAALRAEAEGAAEDYARVVAEAQAKASDAIRRARDAVSADIAARTAALDKELGAKIGAAEAAVGKAREQALAEIEDVAVEVAQAAARRLAGIEVTTAEARAALAEIRPDTGRDSRTPENRKDVA
jgi:F-type H+-transporting ATPase subunit b